MGRNFSDTFYSHSTRNMNRNSYFSPFLTVCCQCLNFLAMSMLTWVSFTSRLVDNRFRFPGSCVRNWFILDSGIWSVFVMFLLEYAELIAVDWKKYNMLPYNSGPSGWSSHRTGLYPPPPAPWNPNLVGASRWEVASGNSCKCPRFCLFKLQLFKYCGTISHRCVFWEKMKTLTKSTENFCVVLQDALR